MRVLVVGLCFLFSLIHFCRGHSFRYSRNDLPTPRMIEESGFPVESHEVQTEDGFILTLHRIPGNKNNGYDKSLLPVFFQHGLFDSSADWVLKGPDDTLAFSLAKKGYDVWLGNIRGNVYSSKHKSLQSNQPEFWNWSWNEMGLYDIPASIDFILNKTKHRKLTYIGHSMGTTVFFVMSSMRPEYNEKIDHMFALAPVAFMSHVKSPIHLLTQHSTTLKDFVDQFGSNGALFPRTNQLAEYLNVSCLSSRFPEQVCKQSLFLFCGDDPAQYDPDMLPLIVGHSPAGTSTKTVVHYAQEIESSKFRQYDYKEENIKKYNSNTPPKYDLSKITAPIDLYYSDNDLLAQPVDVKRLKDELGERAKLHRVNFREFNHLDFLYAREVKSLLNDHIEKLITSKH